MPCTQPSPNYTCKFGFNFILICIFQKPFPVCLYLLCLLFLSSFRVERLPSSSYKWRAQPDASWGTFLLSILYENLQRCQSQWLYLKIWNSITLWYLLGFPNSYSDSMSSWKMHVVVLCSMAQFIKASIICVFFFFIWFLVFLYRVEKHCLSWIPDMWYGSYCTYHKCHSCCSKTR